MGPRFYEYLLENGAPEIIVVEDEREGEEVAAAAQLLQRDFLLLPDFRAVYLDDLRSFKGELDRLNGTLFRYYTSSPSPLLIAPFRTIANPLPAPKYLPLEKIEFGDELDPKTFREKLLQWGYTPVDMVSEVGEMGFRPGIIDLFPPNRERPLRITLDGGLVETIREFDPMTQRSQGEELEEAIFMPALYHLGEEAEQVDRAIERSPADPFLKDRLSLAFWYLPERVNLLHGKRALLSHPLPIEEHYREYSHLIDQESFNLPTLPEPKRWRKIEVLDLNRYLSHRRGKKKITVVARSPQLVGRSSLADLDGIHLLTSDSTLSLEGPDEVIISLNRREKRRRLPKIILDDLKVGDYIVHETHGIGRFQGIQQISILGATRDFVSILYRGGDKLLVPVENLDLISRYTAPEGSPPQLDKLGGGSFKAVKERARKRLLEIAESIVKSGAKRALMEAPKLTADPETLRKFQKGAGFDYTSDQRRAVEKLLAHLASGRPMDMLLSGDVGFGKTEVAMNGMVATVESGYQGALVVPTTLLANQHYRTLKERLAPLGIEVARVDRFLSAKGRREIFGRLERGEIQVVVGTHLLLEAPFSRLGLVVIDEEHKFGVKQKERLKELTSNLHILSMSATPIPRSLDMALKGLKELVELRTPPPIRREVRTYLREYSPPLIKEAAMREFRRGGQLLYIYNSIAGIEEKREELQELLPNSSILVLHSKVPTATAERELLRFAAGDYSILLSTSIVESGLHLPNANTIIVEGADRFGIADLHQLRGRVGRGGKEGYCYLLVNDRHSITEEAQKRLLALESNSFLGSGAALARHDLEIRGGGNIVGAQQSGHIRGVGYTLYLKMLEESIAQMRGEEIGEESPVEIKLTLNAYISPELVKEDRLKLELYRRLAQVRELEEVGEIEEEIEDRFGKIDRPTRNFLDLVAIKVLARKRGIRAITNYNQNISIQLRDGERKLLKARSKDEEEIKEAIMDYLRKSLREG
ncbi:MAG: DEAD/DEAH box helicase [Epsilonproteobacteria bacterium]|nr:transcription-repair coupling factor [Campylobacterota bacterium]NPA56748.1 DEAD/DEAH box helicase [Campylobacterota bacterium]